MTTMTDRTAALKAARAKDSNDKRRRVLQTMKTMETAGQPITAEVTLAQPPAMLWLTDLDGRGLPLASRVLTTTTASTPFTPMQSGRYTLLVEAVWAYDRRVSYLFAVSIQP